MTVKAQAVVSVPAATNVCPSCQDDQVSILRIEVALMMSWKIVGMSYASWFSMWSITSRIYALPVYTWMFDYLLNRFRPAMHVLKLHKSIHAFVQSCGNLFWNRQHDRQQSTKLLRSSTYAMYRVHHLKKVLVEIKFIKVVVRFSKRIFHNPITCEALRTLISIG